MIKYFVRRLREVKDKSITSLFVPKGEEMNGFDTHIPVLDLMLKLIEPQSILELGTGLASTKKFSDYATKHNVKLTSVETNEVWLKHTNPIISDCPSCSIHLSQSCSDFVGLIDENYDLIFIDDGDTYDIRRSTIVKTLEKMDDLKPLCIVIHDYEVKKYQNLVPENWSVFTFKYLRGFTGVLLPDQMYKSIVPNLKQMELLFRDRHRKNKLKINVK